jgi:hypothetical protein
MPDTTVVAAKQKVVARLASLDVPVFFAWQPDVTAECVFLGRALLDASDRDEIDVTYEPTIAEGSWPATESYPLPVSAWSFRPDLTPDEAEAAEVRLQEIVTDMLVALADDDLGDGIRVRPDRTTWRRTPFERGWACFAVIELAVTATVI